MLPDSHWFEMGAPAAKADANKDTVASVAGRPAAALSTSFAAIRRVLNVEGYEVLSADVDRVTGVLDRGLLAEQFGVEV